MSHGTQGIFHTNAEHGEHTPPHKVLRIRYPPHWHCARMIGTSTRVLARDLGAAFTGYVCLSSSFLSSAGAEVVSFRSVLEPLCQKGDFGRIEPLAQVPYLGDVFPADRDYVASELSLSLHLSKNIVLSACTNGKFLRYQCCCRESASLRGSSARKIK